MFCAVKALLHLCDFYHAILDFVMTGHVLIDITQHNYV